MKVKDSEEQFLDLLKALGYIIFTPFVLLSHLFRYIASGARERREAREHEEWMRQHRERMHAIHAEPFIGRTVELEADVFRAFLDASVPNDQQMRSHISDVLVEEIEAHRIRPPSKSAVRSVIDNVYPLLSRDLLFELPPRRRFESKIDEGRYRDELMAAMTHIDNPEQTAKAASDAVFEVIRRFLNRLPPMALASAESDGAQSLTTTRLLDIMPDIPQSVEEIVDSFMSGTAAKLGLYQNVRERLLENSLSAGRKGKEVRPSAFDGSFSECIRTYLQGTPFERLFDVQIPFEIPMARRFEHMAIVSATGGGKTTFLHSLILHDLALDDPPAMVIIDPTGGLVKPLQRLAVFSKRLAGRLIIIDPQNNPGPALNMFDASNPRLQSYGADLREAIEAETIELFNYVFASLSTELTGRQNTAFSFIVRLLLSIPGSNLTTLLELLEDDTPRGAPRFREAIDKLDATAQAFFQHQFYTKTFFATRKQIAGRLYSILRVPAFQRMFSTINKLDMFEELQKGSIILVHTAEALLRENSALFARYIIARTLAAIYERAAIEPGDRKPAFLIVDEAAQFFDETLEVALARVRQYRLGIVLAFQNLHQASEKLLASIAANTSIKLAGTTSERDARALARDMATTPLFIMAQHVDPSFPPAYTRFACHVRNYTPAAISLTIPIGAVDREPQMTEEQVREMVARNRERISDLTISAPQRSSPDEEVGPGKMPETEHSAITNIAVTVAEEMQRPDDDDQSDTASPEEPPEDPPDGPKPPRRRRRRREGWQ